MRRVAEIIHIVEEKREEFLNGAINPDIEMQKVLWLCGVRKQQYFVVNDYIFMTFEYDGKDFKQDMSKMAAYLDSKGHLVNKRRRDVPVDERHTTNWWAPVKRVASILESNPFAEDENRYSLMDMLSGSMSAVDDYADISYDDDDWSEGIGF